MEPVSFAVGIAGLAGLFSACLDAVDRVETYKNFAFESQYTRAQFDADKLLLQKWAVGVGLVDGRLVDPHHADLDDPMTVSRVERILSSIDEILSMTDSKLAVLQQDGTLPNEHESDIHGLDLPSQRDGSKMMKLKKPGLRGSRLAWAMGGKTRFSTKVEVFSTLVEKLYRLVTPRQPTQFLDSDSLRRLEETGNSLTAGMDEAQTWFEESRTDLRKVLERIKIESEKEIYDWLGAIHTSDKFDSCVSKRLPDTCEWLLGNTAYLHWTSEYHEPGKSKIFWMHGPPGSGKSMLSARVIESLSASSPFLPAYFFCASDVDGHSIPLNIVRTWLSQIVSRNQEASDLALEQLQSSRPKRLASESEVWDLFRTLLGCIHDQVFVVDGLDECVRSNEGMRFADKNLRKDFLIRLKESILGTTTKILIVSREETDITSELRIENSELASEIIYEYKLSKEDVQSDIDLFSQAVVNNKLPNKDEALRSHLATKMAQKCEGMFLWIKLQENQLRGGKNGKQLLSIVDNFPLGLNQAYQREWSAILKLKDSDRDRALAILRWAMFSLRPLTLFELTEALVIDADDEDCQELNTDMLPDVVDQEYVNDEILELCGCLLEVRSVDADEKLGKHTVQLAHFSVKQYLLSIMVDKKEIFSDQELQQSYLGKVCLRYLNYKTAWLNFNVDGIKLYAVTKWILHFRESGKHCLVMNDLINQLFETNNANWGKWIMCFESTVDSKSNLKNGDPSTRLYVASFLGLPETVEYLLNQGPQDLNRVGGVFGTPLQAACVEGHESTMNTLVERGAEVNLECGMFGSPFNCAVAFGHESIARKLLKDGADLTIKDSQGRSSYFIACKNGHTALVRLLLDLDVDINVQLDDGSTALHAAAHNGHVEVIKLLACRNADFDLRKNDGSTPLHEAVGAGHVDAVEVLLDLGADIKLQTESGWTVLYAATIRGYDNIVKLLLNRGADLDIAAKDGSTPLLGAAQNGYPGIVDLLLKKGASVATRFKGWTPLHAAAYRGITQTVQLLLDENADVDVTTKPSSKTPLNIAARQGKRDVVELLLHYGADMEIPDRTGSTPLISAAYQGHATTVETLLAKKANLAASNSKRWTALHAASVRGHLEVTKMLLEHGADIKAVSKYGVTPLVLAAGGGHESVSRFLVTQEGVEIDSKDSFGRTPLFWAVSDGSLSTVVILVNELGAKAYQSTPDGKTALHIAALAGDLEIFDFFLSLNLDSHGEDSRGVGIMSYAAAGSSFDIVSRLLETHGPDPKKDGNWSVLHWACRGGDWRLVNLLLERGFKSWTVDTTEPEESWTPLDIAAVHNPELLLEEHSSFISALKEKIEGFSSAGCPPNIKQSVSSANQASAVNWGSRYTACDLCDQMIYGPRFQCATCDDFNYCFMCKLTADKTHFCNNWVVRDFSK